MLQCLRVNFGLGATKVKDKKKALIVLRHEDCNLRDYSGAMALTYTLH